MAHPSRTPYRTIEAREFLDQLLMPPAPGAAQQYEYGGIESAPLGVEGVVSLAGRVIDLPVRIEHVIFLDPVDLSECRVEGALRLDHCEFRKGLVLRDLRVDGEFALRFCRLTDPDRRWIDCRRLRIQGLADFTCTLSTVGVDFANSIFGDDIRLDGYRGRSAISQETDIPAGLPESKRAHLKNEMLEKALNFEEAEFRKRVCIYPHPKKRFRIHGQIDLRARVGGQVVFDRAIVTALKDKLAVNMFAAFVAGSVFFANGTAVTGQIDLRAKVNGQVNFKSAIVTAGKDKLAVNLAAADVAGSVIFINGTAVTGQIDLRAKVGGQVVFNSVSVVASLGIWSVLLQSADVAGSVFFRGGTYICGGVSCFQAVFRKGLCCTFYPSEITFHKPTTGEATRELLLVGRLDLSFATIHGPVLFHGASIWGDIDARHLTVHGDLDWCGSIIANSRIHPVDMLHLVDSSRKLFSEFREVIKNQHEIEKQVQVYNKANELKTWSDEETKLTTGRPAKALDLGMACVHGRFWMKSTRLLGTANLEDARITGEANFEDGIIHGDVKMRSAVIEGRVFADEKRDDTESAYPCVRGHVDLSYAKLSQVDLKFQATASENMPKYLNLTGATVDTLHLRGNASLGPRDDRGELVRARGLLIADGLNVRNLEVDESVYHPTQFTFSVRDKLRMAIWFLLLCAIAILAVRARSLGLFAALALYFFLCAWGRIRDRLELRDTTNEDVKPEKIIAKAAWLWQLIRNRLSRPERKSWLAKVNWVFLPARKSSPILDMLNYSYPFSRGFYISVENWLRSSGDDARADEAFLMRRRRETERPVPPPDVLAKAAKREPALREHWQTPSAAMRSWSRSIDFALGFGVRWTRMAHLYLLLFLINTGVFLNRESVERPLSFVQQREARPTDASPEIGPQTGKPEPYWEDDGGRPHEHRWGFFNAFFMAMRVQVPILALGAENDWEPSSRPFFWHITYEEWASLMVVVNFILIPLMVAGMTRQFRKQGTA